MTRAALSAAAPGQAPRPAGQVGPNAVLQTAAALVALEGRAQAETVFAQAGLSAYWHAPPDAMIDQATAAALMRAVPTCLGTARGRAVLAMAGRLTGDYILAHRIPRTAQAVSKHLPARLAAPLLGTAIARHAWTFAGTGRVAVTGFRRLSLTIEANPLAVAECVWHVAVFERLFQRLVAPRWQVGQTACCGRGDAACRFLIGPPDKQEDTP